MAARGHPDQGPPMRPLPRQRGLPAKAGITVGKPQPLWTLAICVFLVPAAAAKIIYVDDSAGGLGDGTNWADAFTNLARALDHADPGDEIRVAQGVYRPTTRTESFELRKEKANGAQIRGGYAGFGTPDPDARNTKAYRTTLSGDLNGDDGPNFQNNGENCYHVVSTYSVGPTTVLDGFIIQGGNANGASPEEKSGGGMYNHGAGLKIVDCNFVGNFAQDDGGAVFNTANSAPRVIGCRFSGNCAKYGGAVRNLDSRCLLVHCTFRGNQADSHGGGMYSGNSSVELIACAFYANSAGSGGGAFNHVSDPNLINCVFSDNSATGGGGGLYNYGNRPRLTNCTFSRNSAGFGGGLYNVDAAPVLTNCILRDNRSAKGTDEEAQIHLAGGTPAVSHCCIQNWMGQWPGLRNTNQDPLFAAGEGGDDNLRLLKISPCVDTGDTNALPADTFDLDNDKNVAEPIPFDFLDHRRVSNGVVDRGAFEFQEGLALDPVLHVNATAKGPGDGQSWATALPSLQTALQTAVEHREVREIWVAAGVYKPAATNGAREATFQLLSNVAIYGGFAGSETNLEERDPNRYVTTLSGDLRGNDVDVPNPCDLLGNTTRADNCYHVVTGSGTDATAILDGFTITGGIAGGPSNADGGGAYIMAGRPTIRRCTLQDNAARGNGGGLYCLFSNPTIRNCTIRRNSVGLGAEIPGSGGGLYCDTSSPLIQDNLIAENYGTGYGAGIACEKQSAPWIVHNTLRANTAPAEGSNGGGIGCLEKSAPWILRNTMVGNAAYDGGGIYCNDASPKIINNLFIANTAEDDGGGIRKDEIPLLLPGTYPAVTAVGFALVEARDDYDSIPRSWDEDDYDDDLGHEDLDRFAWASQPGT